MQELEVVLAGGRITAGVVRVGDTVRRPLRAGSPAVHDLLRYLDGVGFDGAPKFLGIDERGREILSYLPGEVPPDLGAYDDAALVAAARLLRRFHDATMEFPAVAAAGAEVMCHNDWGPPNAVFRDGLPIGIIDFDTSRPGLRLWDMGYTAASWLDLGNDAYSGAEQIRRLALFLGGYGRPDYSVAMLAAFCVARRATLAVAGRRQGNPGLAAWAYESADWIVENISERVLPTGMVPTPV